MSMCVCMCVCMYMCVCKECAQEKRQSVNDETSFRSSPSTAALIALAACVPRSAALPPLSLRRARFSPSPSRAAAHTGRKAGPGCFYSVARLSSPFARLSVPRLFLACGGGSAGARHMPHAAEREPSSGAKGTCRRRRSKRAEKRSPFSPQCFPPLAPLNTEKKAPSGHRTSRQYARRHSRAGAHTRRAMRARQPRALTRAERETNDVSPGYTDIFCTRLSLEYKSARPGPSPPCTISVARCSRSPDPAAATRPAAPRTAQGLSLCATGGS